MIPAAWTEYRREDDDEIVGYLAPAADGSGDVVPVTIFGYPLAEASDEYDASRVLDAVGLGSLAEKWSLAIDGRDDPISVQIVEASPHVVRVKNVDLGYEGDYGVEFVLETPVSDALHMR